MIKGQSHRLSASSTSNRRRHQVWVTTNVGHAIQKDPGGFGNPTDASLGSKLCKQLSEHSNVQKSFRLTDVGIFSKQQRRTKAKDPFGLIIPQ
jgi:hypothetical protein